MQTPCRALCCTTHLPLPLPLCCTPPPAPGAGTLKARARVTLAGAIISCVALFALLLVVGIFDEEAGKATRRGGTGERCACGSNGLPARPPARLPACLLVAATAGAAWASRCARCLPATESREITTLQPFYTTAGEPKGETYGGVYQPTEAQAGSAEAATYAYPTRE